MNATLSLYAETKFSGFTLEVFLINEKRDFSFSTPSIINFPLKILCLQCSELTWEKPKISESDKFLPIKFEILLK